MSRQYKHNPEYQAIIFNVILKALERYSRLMVIRCDLRFPLEQVEAEDDPKVITRFISSLKAKIKSDLKRKEKAWGRRLECSLHYVWVREFGDVNGNKHYHVLLFFNKDIYHSLGDFRQSKGNLSAMIKQAWCSATGLDYYHFPYLVHFPERGIFYLDKNKSDIQQQIAKVVKHAEYLAKNVTKRYGDGDRSIGSSL